MNKKMVKLAEKMNLHKMPGWAVWLLAALFLVICYNFYLELWHMKNAESLGSPCSFCGE